MTELFPVFEYYVAGQVDALHPEGSSFMESLWDMPLSGKKKGLSDKSLPISIGDYFLSAHKFLEKDDFLFLKEGLETELACKVEVDEIEKIIICLEKHGPFYHPIKTTAFLKDEKRAHFVLNGAVSDMGLVTIEKEYQNLKQLYFDGMNQGKSGSNSYIPKVFGLGFVESDKGKTGFFLAQWFDGFEEFHVIKTDNTNKIGILNSDGSFSIIPDSKAIKIFTEASKILTFYYEIRSLKQIFPWHHAAGDFVVKISDDDVEVKLITVRSFNTLMESDNLFLGLFFFFLNLSLRMRVDRNEGTKEYIFLDESVVKACIDGFIIGLQKNLNANQNFSKSNPDFFGLFVEFIKDFDLTTLLNIFIMILGSYNENATEVQIIEKNLEHHAKTVFESLQGL